MNTTDLPEALAGKTRGHLVDLFFFHTCKVTSFHNCRVKAKPCQWVGTKKISEVGLGHL